MNSVIDIRAKDESIDYLIGNKGELTVYGNGGIVFSVMSENHTSCVFGNWGSGQMSVWGNVNIEGKNDRADGSCAALYAEVDKVEYFANINKGKATIVITGLGDNGTGTTKYYGSKKISFKIGKGILNWL